uniref:Uncharacterized protein n=1 Tax=viral metagenome TaxID=1070528 RepID=A0A6M3JWD5_9ZZZZ
MDYRLTDEAVIVLAEVIEGADKNNLVTSREIAQTILNDGYRKLSEGCEDAREKIEDCIELSCFATEAWIEGEISTLEFEAFAGYANGQILQEVLIPEIEKAKKEGREEVIEWQQNHKVIGFCFDTGDEDEGQDLRLAWSLQLQEWDNL